MTAFEEMAVMPELGQAVEEMDWSLPTDVQSEAIPMILGGGDVLMAAETGSGKTGKVLVAHPPDSVSLKDLKGKGKLLTKAHGGGGKWKMNVYDRGDAMAIDPEGSLCQARDPQGWHGTRSNKAVTGKGKYYYEAEVTDEGLCRVGWSTDKASLDLGTDKFGYGFGGTGKKSYGRQFDSYGEAYGMNDVIGCYLDLENGDIKWSKNGVDLGKAYTIPQHLRTERFFAAVVLKNAEMSFNFGGHPFKFPPQKGTYVGLNQAPQKDVIESRIMGSGAVNAKPAPNAPQAIIIEPSRELAEQTFTQIQKFKVHLSNPSIRELLIIGGVNVKEQVDVLQKGVDIVVGTPGRLEDLISTGKLTLHQVRFFVLDEAERLMYFPTWIDLKGADAVPETVHHVIKNIGCNSIQIQPIASMKTRILWKC
ncbi:DDX1 [Mytilus coruscus]|uniref:RNA helicase n=1 Tax=Mytilus coruscus TaxID=42192 RepID=A0A6J7ZXD2_MYTCO|nr:DDX1 [Mytilus coruscus]